MTSRVGWTYAARVALHLSFFLRFIEDIKGNYALALISPPSVCQHGSAQVRWSHWRAVIPQEPLEKTTTGFGQRHGEAAIFRASSSSSASIPPVHSFAVLTVMFARFAQTRSRLSARGYADIQIGADHFRESATEIRPPDPMQRKTQLEL